jgi:hypothetical protein
VVKRAAITCAVAAWLAACRFGGPTGDPSMYVALPDDAASPDEGGAEDAQADASDALASDGSVGGDATLDAPSTEASTQVEAAVDGGPDAPAAEGESDSGCAASDAACDAMCPGPMCADGG